MRPVIDFSSLRLNGKEPVYLQIVQFIKRKILLKEALDGDELPSRRDLAIKLDINPNTVQKAYRLLEEEGLIRTGSNVRSQLCVDEESTKRIEQELTTALVMDFIQSARQVRLSLDRVVELIEHMWKNEQV